MRDSFDKQRAQLINHTLKANGIHDPHLLSALHRVPRHAFVPRHLQHLAYENQIVSIGQHQIMLPPLTIATILQSLMLSGHEIILEVGTGTGYLTALLTQLGGYVFSLESNLRLAQQAAERLATLDYNHVDLHMGDGSQGLPDMAPFDVIIATAAVPKVPKQLAAQLASGGRLVMPVGHGRSQRMRLLLRSGDQWQARTLLTTRTTRLKGRNGFQSDASANA